MFSEDRFHILDQEVEILHIPADGTGLYGGQISHGGIRTRHFASGPLHRGTEKREHETQRQLFSDTCAD